MPVRKVRTFGSLMVTSALAATALCALPAGAALAVDAPTSFSSAPMTLAATPSETLAAQAWETTGAVDHNGDDVALDDPNVSNFVGLAYYKTDGTFTMYNLDESPKMQGDWTVSEDGTTRTLVAKGPEGNVLFTRVVPITVLTDAEFTYRVIPNDANPEIYFDIVHTPTTHTEPGTLSPSDVLASTAWETTGAVDHNGDDVALNDPNVANFVGWAYYKTDGTFTMYNLNDTPKMQGDWTVSADGKSRTLVAKGPEGNVLFTRVVPITVLTDAEFTYRVIPNEANPEVYFDIIHKPTTHAEPKAVAPSSILSATPWKTTGAVDQTGKSVALTDPAVANFVGWAYYKTDGTFTMYNLDDTPKMQGDWSVSADGKSRTLVAKDATGKVLFTRVVPITVLTDKEFTYRVIPDAENPGIYYDIVHTPTDHAEPTTPPVVKPPTTKPAYVARTVPVFADTPVSHKFYKEIDWMHFMNYSTGWKQASGKPMYKPQDKLQRAAMAAFIFRMEADPNYKAPKVSPFADVKTTDTFYKQIAWMAEKGYSTGWAEPNGKPTYRPYENLTREAMAAFIYRLEGSKPYTAPKVSPLADMKPGMKFYKEINWMYTEKLTTGNKVGDTKEYWPKDELSRQAMAAFIFRLANDYRTK